MRLLKVTYINPLNDMPETTECFSNQTAFSDTGMTFKFNDHYPTCEVLSIEEVPQELVAAQDAYFAQYGTSAEF